MISLCPPVFCFLASTVVYCSALIDTVTSHKVHVAQRKYRSQTGAVPYAYNAHLAECRCVTQIHHHHPPPHPHGGRLRLTLVQLLYLLLTDTLRGALNSLGNCCNCLFMSIFYISSSLSSLGFWDVLNTIWLLCICELWEATGRVRTVDNFCHGSVLAEIHILEVFQLWHFFWVCNVLHKSLNRLKERVFSSICVQCGIQGKVAKIQAHQKPGSDHDL